MVFMKRKTSSKGGSQESGNGGSHDGGDAVKILRKGPAMRVIFFYPGEEGTYVDNAEVTLFENCIVHIRSPQEETTTHLQNCEILWTYETDTDDRKNKVRLLKIKPKTALSPDLSPSDNTDDENPGHRDMRAPVPEL